MEEIRRIQAEDPLTIKRARILRSYRDQNDHIAESNSRNGYYTPLGRYRRQVQLIRAKNKSDLDRARFVLKSKWIIPAGPDRQKLGCPTAKSIDSIGEPKVETPDSIGIHDPYKKRKRSEGTTETKVNSIQTRSEKLNKNWSLSSDGLVLFKNRIYIPAAANLRQTLMELYHDDPLAGHFGERRTTELIKMNFHWEGIDEEVKSYIKACAICQGVKTPRHLPYGKLNSLPIPIRPWSELTMDFITGLP